MLLSLQLSAEEGIKLNQIQVLGTHNSYHLSKRIQLFPSLNYQHPPLFQQLELGARQLELDLHYHKRKKELYIHHVPEFRIEQY